MVKPASLQELPRWDAILVDDDELVRATWQLQALLASKRLLVFESAEEILEVLYNFHPDTPVYIDFQLGKGNIQGYALVQELHRNGFRELHLATGLCNKTLESLPHIKSVRGKNPPWSS